MAGGTKSGIIQLELAATTVVPDGKGGTKNELVVTAHVRCSEKAAADLRRAIDAVLLLAAKTEGQAH